MLLETMDMAETRILIYSQNKFDFNSFRIIEKDEKPRKPKKINYFTVCDHIKSVCPKNLVIYRLRTNVEAIDPFSTKFGYFIKIDESLELVYFDPVFAIKDLKQLKFNLDPDKFRFKIQQVGLQSVNISGKEAVYQEVYSFDMRAIEAQYQNDRIFAEAIFALDPDYISEEDETDDVEKESGEKKLDKIEDNVEDSLADLSNIKEDEETKNEELQKFDFDQTHAAIDKREEKVKSLKNALGISEAEEQEVEEQEAEEQIDEPVIEKSDPAEEEMSDFNSDEEDSLDNAIEIIEPDDGRLGIDNPRIETRYDTSAESEDEADQKPDPKPDPKYSKKSDKQLKKFEEAEKREEYFYATNATNTNDESDETEDEELSDDDKTFLDWDFSNSSNEEEEAEDETEKDNEKELFLRKKLSEPDEKKLMKQLDVLDLFKSKKSAQKRESVLLKFSKD